jgi:hypothetical protein
MEVLKAACRHEPTAKFVPLTAGLLSLHVQISVYMSGHYNNFRNI